jgi:hypothetical protein
LRNFTMRSFTVRRFTLRNFTLRNFTVKFFTLRNFTIFSLRRDDISSDKNTNRGTKNGTSTDLRENDCLIELRNARFG